MEVAIQYLIWIIFDKFVSNQIKSINFHIFHSASNNLKIFTLSSSVISVSSVLGLLGGDLGDVAGVVRHPVDERDTLAEEMGETLAETRAEEMGDTRAEDRADISRWASRNIRR